MKLISFLFALIVATVANATKPAFTTSKKVVAPNSKVLELRGGGSVGPIDADLISKVGSTSLALYIGSSASKWVAGQTGGSAPDVSVAGEIVIEHILSCCLLTDVLRLYFQ